MDAPNDFVLKELMDTACNNLELPYRCVKVAQDSLFLSGAGLCNLYLIYDGEEGEELLSMAHSVTCEDLEKDPREIKLSNVMWDNKRGILGHVARTGEEIMIERMSLVRKSTAMYIQDLTCCCFNNCVIRILSNREDFNNHT